MGPARPSTGFARNLRTASHIDSLRDKVEGHRIQNHLKFEKMRLTAETSESDLRLVYSEDRQADKQLRSELDTMSVLLSAGHDQLTAEVTSLKAELSTLSGPAGPPGLESARLTGHERKRPGLTSSRVDSLRQPPLLRLQARPRKRQAQPRSSLRLQQRRRSRLRRQEPRQPQDLGKEPTLGEATTALMEARA